MGTATVGGIHREPGLRDALHDGRDGRSRRYHRGRGAKPRARRRHDRPRAHRFPGGRMTGWRAIVPAACAALACGAAAGATGDRIDVDITGVDGLIRDNVYAILSLQRLSRSDQLDENVVGRLVQRAPGEVRTALRPFGYYEPGTEVKLLKTEAG